MIGESASGASAGQSWDTVPPRINYALTLPGETPNQLGADSAIYFQMSEPVDESSTTLVSLSSGPASISTFAPSPTNLIPLGLGGSAAREFLIPLDGTYAVTDLANTVYSFTLNQVKDIAAEAEDRHFDPNEAYSYRFPSPKYPRDYDYSTYEFIRGHVLNGPPGTPASGTVVPRPNELNGLSYGGAPMGEASHRITDVLVSVPPLDRTEQRYFVWPVFARYASPANAGAVGSDDFGPGEKTDTGIIWNFNGTKFLEERDTDLQAHLNTGPSGFSGLIGMDPKIYYGSNVPQEYIAGTNNGNPGLWLPGPYPTPPVPDFVNLAPEFFPGAVPKGHVSLTGSNYLYKFLTTDPGYKSGSMISFFFHLDGTLTDLFVARLDMQPGAGIPPDWYRLVRPFSFEVHDITRQRSGVTILNNVINPTVGESTYVQYQLAKSGQVTIQVFTLDGTMVKSLYRGRRDAGEYRAVWDGKNNGGRAVARGMYFIRVVCPDND
jgi:hypothetical protein